MNGGLPTRRVSETIGSLLGAVGRASATQRRATAAACDPSRAVRDRRSLTVGLASRAGSRASTGAPDRAQSLVAEHAPAVEFRVPVAGPGLGRLQVAAFVTAAASEASAAVVHAASAAVAAARAASPAAAPAALVVAVVAAVSLAAVRVALAEEPWEVVREVLAVSVAVAVVAAVVAKLSR
jgi:hypothetical protein